MVPESAALPVRSASELISPGRHFSALMFGLLDTSAQLKSSSLAAKLRSFTISWSRYGYHGPIFEGKTLDAILAQAAAAGCEYCLIQSYGHIIIEPWAPTGCNSKDFHQSLVDLIEGDFALATVSDKPGSGSAPPCLLVNVTQWEDAGRPPLELIGAGLLEGRVNKFPAGMMDRTLYLGPDATRDVSKFAAYLDDSIETLDLTWLSPQLSVDQRKFLTIAQAHVNGAKRGVFLWNVESYSDVEEPAAGFSGSINTLACVAAGFKPNMILSTYGFNDNTRVVFFDYSTKALAFRKLLYEEWNGEDYPEFVQYVFRKLPPPETFYHLWNDRAPQDICADDLQKAWEAEISRWGNARLIKDHWREYRRLKHEFVHYDILTEPSELLERLGTSPNDVIWWSNAFFTVYSNWYLTVGERKVVYDAWINGLVKRNRELILYGFDYNNTSVNGIAAGTYADRYLLCGGDYLNPDPARLQICC